MGQEETGPSEGGDGEDSQERYEYQVKVQPTSHGLSLRSAELAFAKRFASCLCNLQSFMKRGKGSEPSTIVRTSIGVDAFSIVTKTAIGKVYLSLAHRPVLVDAIRHGALLPLIPRILPSHVPHPPG